MNRRDTIAALLALGATAGPLHAVAQVQAARKPYRIALLPDFRPDQEPLLRLFTETLRELGRIEGRDFVFYRSGILYGQDTERSAKLVVDEKPDLIVSSNLGYAMAAHKLTKTIPIVMRTSGFPVEGGVAMSLARPGKNVTGLTIYAGAEVFGKLVQLLYEVKPGIKRIGAVCSYLPPFHTAEEADAIIGEMQNAARLLGIDLRILRIARSEQLADALATVTAERMEALLLTSGASVGPRLHEITQLALEKRLPTVIDWRWPAIEPQPLMSYAAVPEVLVRQTAAYVNRILWERAKPGELPIQLPAKIELTVNMKVAKSLGITIPTAILLRADTVIE